MKRILSMLLVLALSACAFAEPLTDELSELTLKVKSVIGDIGVYDFFDISSAGERYWLYWYGENGSCSVTADAGGTVYSYRTYTYDGQRTDGIFGCRFPEKTSDEIKQAADGFLSRAVTADGWGYVTGEVQTSLSGGVTCVEGCLTLYGIRTDITVSLSVDSDTGRVLSFSRSDSYSPFRESPAAAEPAVGAAQAYAILTSALSLDAVYEAVEEGQMARLVYVPDRDIADLIIRADDGSFIENHYSVYHKGMATDEASLTSAAAGGLTEYELKGIGEYEGALTLEELEAAVRDVTAIGITGKYTLETSGWYTCDEKPCAVMTFTNGSVYRVVRVNAEDGRITDMYSYNYDLSVNVDLSGSAAAYRSVAEDFLKEYYPEYASQTVYTDAYDGSAISWNSKTVNYVFCREYSGYRFRSNSVIITVNPSDRTVCGISIAWDNGQEFYEPPENLIGAEAALRLLLEGAEATTLYTSVYDEKAGKSELVLSWKLEDGSDAWAFDAEDGRAYTIQSEQQGAFVYEDTEGMLYADEIAKLGLYGIGIEGCGFTAEDICTPEILMTLFLQAAGCSAPGDLYAAFMSRFGTIPEEEIDRAELARIAVYAAGYSKVLNLTGIFTMPAADWDSVPEHDRGALAAAYALGLMDVDENGCIGSSAQAEAAEAAHILYLLLSR